jgi:hypothetical protein
VARRTKRSREAVDAVVLTEEAVSRAIDRDGSLDTHVLAPTEHPFAGLTYDEVIERMVENINAIFVENDCTLADAKVAIDAFQGQLLAMTAEAEGPRAAQELAFKYMQNLLPYIFNPSLDEDPRGSFKSILDSVRDNLIGESTNG